MENRYKLFNKKRIYQIENFIFNIDLKFDIVQMLTREKTNLLES